MRGAEIINLQKRYAIRAASLRPFVGGLRRRLRLAQKEFNICFVDDRAIRRLNLAYRGKNKSTDVLSFSWSEAEEAAPSPYEDFANFLGDVVISVETARRNARAEGHSTLQEIRWLILHGVLHLLGYDHERDRGEMVALELRLREEMGVAGTTEKQGKRQRAKGRSSIKPGFDFCLLHSGS